jgi:hypothetical protein
MQRRGFLRLSLAVGLSVAAAMTLRVADAAAAPLSPAPLAAQHDLHRAVTSGEEAGRLAPQQVHWGHHWHHRHGGWHHRHWHHRHWGWHRHHWHHHHWRRHHW